MSDDGPPASPACGANVNLDLGAFDTSSDEDHDQSATSSEDEVVVSSRSRRRSSRRSPAEDRSSGRVAVHQLDGTQKFVRASAAVAAAAPIVENPWKEVEVQYYMCASLNDLESGAKDAVLKLADRAMAFGGKDGNRTKNHICGGVHVTEIDSTFPCSLHLDVDGMETDSPIVRMTHEGSSGALTIRPKSSFSNPEGIQIVTGNSNVADKSAFLRDYATWTPDNVDTGITYAEDEDGEEQAFLKKGHPVISYFNEARRDAGEQPLTDENLLEGTKLFMASATDTRKCLAALKKAMSSRLQIQDLYKVQFNLRRARGEVAEGKTQPAWNDETEVGDAVHGQNSREALMKTPNKLYITVKYKYKSLG